MVMGFFNKIVNVSVISFTLKCLFYHLPIVLSDLLSQLP